MNKQVKTFCVIFLFTFITSQFIRATFKSDLNYIVSHADSPALEMNYQLATEAKTIQLKLENREPEVIKIISAPYSERPAIETGDKEMIPESQMTYGKNKSWPEITEEEIKLESWMLNPGEWLP